MTTPQSIGDVLQNLRATPPSPATRTVKGAASADDEPHIVKDAILRDTAPATPSTPKEEQAMPRGVYDRSKAKKRGEAAATPPVAKKRGGRPKKNGEGADLKALATEALIDAARHLATTVREVVDLDDAPVLVTALRSFELAEKIAGAVG